MYLASSLRRTLIRMHRGAGFLFLFNIFVLFWRIIFQQVVGIQIGSNCVTWRTRINIASYDYEIEICP